MKTFDEREKFQEKKKKNFVRETDLKIFFFV